MPGEAVKGLDLDIRKGEIIGLGGLAGQGKIGVSNGILGLYPSDGSISYEGQQLPMNNPLAVLKRKIAFVSEDRRNVGLILSESIEENIAIGALRVNGKFLKKYGPVTQIDKKAVKDNSDRMIEDFKIKFKRRQPAKSLHGPGADYGAGSVICIRADPRYRYWRKATAFGSSGKTESREGRYHCHDIQRIKRASLGL